MKSIILKQISMVNFKKYTEKTIVFGGKETNIYCCNFGGKSSIFDAFTWCLFNKSSTGNTEGKQFRPRRYDEHGKNVDHVDVVVELVLLVDGEEVKIKKTQKQEWVRHRGDDYDSYMGDRTEYEWNDVPVSATNHKKKVEEIISEEVFRMISNPAAFPSLPEKKQREFLLTNIANITDADVFAISIEFEPVRAAMGKGTLEELIAKNKKELTTYQKRMEEIPVIINYESNRFTEVPNFDGEKARLADLQSQLADIESRLEGASKGYEQVNELRNSLYSSKGRLAEIQAKITSEHNRALNNLRVAISKANDEFQTANMEHTEKERRLEILKSKLEIEKKSLEDTKKEYQIACGKTIDEDSFICPTCGQTMPEDKKQEIKDKFENQKADELKRINESGQYLSNSIADTRVVVSTLENEIQGLKNKKVESMREQNRLACELADLESKGVDFESNEEYMSLKDEISALETQIESIDTTSADAIKEQLKTERASVQAQIDSVKEALALEKVIEQSKANIEALKAEMQEVTQKVADRERLESQIEKFNRAKMDLLSEKINDKFKMVSWRLFEQQKNRRFADACVCMLNGSSYGENTTSATERMICGMDIINTLQTIYKVQAPIFLDDADLYNDENIPLMNSQLIKLCVSLDKDLRVVGV